MKLYFSSLLFLLVFLSSCQEDPKVRALEQEKETQKRDAIFSSINKGWNLNSHPINKTSNDLTSNWAEWRLFLNELGQKPKSSIGAFQQKAKSLSKRAVDLNNNIPIEFNLPEIKSRIAVLTTKINSVNLYIHLNQIPDKKIIKLLQEINAEVVSMQWQLDEIKRKSEIKTEEGESDMLKMLDTTRAIPMVHDPKLKPHK
ncbi:MAG: hypothetical protein EBS55_00020 [Flavobacteriaceae bacterium]|nr:hypothetical protein [Flavobacteriaceae bacterium]